MSVHVNDIKLSGKKQNIDPMWTVLMKHIDLGEPTTFFDHVQLGCTQRECETSKEIVNNLQKYVRIQNFCRSNRKIPGLRKSDANISAWSYDMEGHAKKYVERYCELANKTTPQQYKVSTPCLDDH